MKKIVELVLISMLLVCTTAAADSYRVTTLRASPGQFEALLRLASRYRDERQGEVILMRHSQGDQWDLMLLEPAGANAVAGKDFSSLVDFQHNFLADSASPWADVKKSAATAGLYHIEMFHALAGKKAGLIDQRHRENRYLMNTGQTTNTVFVTTFGSDVDVFTVGFHADMNAFAKGPTVSDEQAEDVAKQAGFKDRADLGFYLRSLLISHHDTLAGPVGQEHSL